jgi:Cdc6-like AAA superfamily ATPase
MTIQAGGDIVGRDKNIFQPVINLFTGTSDQQRDLRNRHVMLTAVRKFWVEGVLEHSLHGAALIELGMEEKKEAVHYPWDMVLQRPNQPNRQLLPGTKMIDMFDQAGRSLLILGEPGSGKTTMLLELARQTIERAEKDLAQPIPVVFNLSSWAEKQFSLAEWLVEELNTKYQIPKKVAQKWVENDELLLLLDGLDEVAQAQRVACVEAINIFHRNSLMPLVVCSRVADYEKLSAKLSLEQAIVLKSLTVEQVEAYLDQFKADLTTLQRKPGL